MNENGALVEWYWEGKLIYLKKNSTKCLGQVNQWLWGSGGKILTGEIDLFGEKYYKECVVCEWMRMEHWWNDTERWNWFTSRKIV